MTDEDALNLRRGDRVRVVRGKVVYEGRVRRVSVTPMREGGPLIIVYVYRNGLTRSGRPKGLYHCAPWTVHALETHAPGTANVFADFLEEHGHFEAAEVLRRAFPLSAPAPTENNQG